MKSLTARIAMAIAFVVVCFADVQAAAPPGRSTGNNLRKRLLAELLEEAPADSQRVQDMPAVDAHSLSSTARAARAEEKSIKPAPEIGAAVASIPTWPVIILSLLLAATFWWMKNGRHKTAGPAGINRLATIPLGGKRSLALVEVMGHKLLLGLAEKSLCLLTRIDECAPERPGPRDAAVSGSEPEVFEEDLRALIRDNDSYNASCKIAPPKEPPRGERKDLARKIRMFRGV